MLPPSARPAIFSAEPAVSVLSSGFCQTFLIIGRPYSNDGLELANPLLHAWSRASGLTSGYQLLIDKIGEQFTQIRVTFTRRDVIFVEQHRPDRFE